MDSDDKFWFSLWTVGILGVVTLVVIINLFVANTDNKIMQMTKQGVDPHDAYCSLRGNAETACDIRRRNGN